MASLRSCSGRALLVPFLFFAAITLPVVGLAGNTRAFFLGDEAAMTGGAGVAVARDSGAIWYNPAGLGGLEVGRMELTATAYKLKLRRVDSFVKAELPGREIKRDMSFNNFGAVPTSIVFVRNLNEDISYGLAIYQTGNLVESIRIEMNETFPSGKWRLGLESHEQAFRYHIGPAIGWQLHDRFRLGFSLFVVYDTFTSNQQEFLSLSVNDSSGTTNYAYLWSSYLDAMILGFKVQLGLQYEFVRNWHLAFVFRSPEIVVFESETYVGYDVAIDDDFENEATGEHEEIGEWQFTGSPDVEAQLAIAYKNEKFWIGTEAAVRPRASEEEDILWNAGIGGRFFLSDTFNIGAGLFTDRSTGLEPEWIFQEETDRYGLSLGGEIRTPIKVMGEKGARALSWTTTLALVYSVEVGKIGGLSFDSDFSGDFPTRDVVFHQLFVHLGSSLYF